MSSERRIHHGTIYTRPKSVELTTQPPQKAGVMDLFKNPFSSRKAPRTPVDLNNVIDEMQAEQKLDQQTNIIAPNAPEVEFHLLAQRIRGASKEDQEQILRVVYEFEAVNKKAAEEGKSRLPVTAIPKGVKEGKIGEVEDIAAEHIPFDQMPGESGLRVTPKGFALYQVTDENPLLQLQAGTIAHQEAETKLALVQQREVTVQPKGVETIEQKGMTAVIMLEDDPNQIAGENMTKKLRDLPKHNFFLEDKDAA